MANRKGSFSKKGNFIEFYGTAELLNKIEAAGKNVKKAIERSLLKSAELPKRDMLNFMQQHKLTGATEASFVDNLVKWDGDKLTLKTGFDIKKGGLPALMLDIGTPHIKPSFFVYYAVENNVDKIKQIQMETLQEILKELQ